MCVALTPFTQGDILDVESSCCSLSGKSFKSVDSDAFVVVKVEGERTVKEGERERAVLCPVENSVVRCRHV